MFLALYKIDILLVSVYHLTSNTNFKMPSYITYNAAHPDIDRFARAGAAVIIRQGIKHHLLSNIEILFIQATSIEIEHWIDPIVISAVYCPPNYLVN